MYLLRSGTGNIIVSLRSILHLSSPKVDLSTSSRNRQDAIEFVHQLLLITTYIIFSVPAFLAKLKKQRKGLKWWLWEVVVIGGPALRAFIREF